MVTGSTEIERKFSVDGDTPVPDLTRLQGVGGVGPAREFQLEAVYYDTVGHALARARTTLRRRAGGSDDGWHLKLPGDGRARRELHLPLDDAPQPPAQLVEMVADLLDGPLVDIARLRTHRSEHDLIGSDGRRLAVFCDDRVESRGLTEQGQRNEAWREWELELVEGDDSLLVDAEAVLAAAGARPAENVSKLARAIGR